MITVVGLGNKRGDLTLRGAEAIDGSDIVIVKTALTDTYSYFVDKNVPHKTLDFIYESSEDFDLLDKNIVDYLLSLDGNICYCVNGSGNDDRSVILLKERTQVNTILGVSHESEIMKNTPSCSYMTVSCYDILEDKIFNYDKTKPLVIKEIDNMICASEVKQVLSRLVGDEERITLVDKDSHREIFVYELDRQKNYDYSTSVYVRPLSIESQLAYSYDDLVRIIYRLRAKDGCEWDKVQTHESIRKNLIEEAYELVTAIDNSDIDNIIEEAGDVILQGVFHAIIGEDEGEFDMYEVVNNLCKKLVFRHKHIFGGMKANNAEEALKIWESAKAEEKKQESLSDKLDSIASAMPSLMRASKVQKYAKKYGYDFINQNQVVDKVKEELDEVLASDKEHLEIECGDLLFAVVNLLRFMDIDGEVALGRSIEKVVKRLKFCEEKCKSLGKNLRELDSIELDKLWCEAKQNEDR